MTYSFIVRGSSKTEVLNAAQAKLDELVNAQPLHAGDRDAIERGIANALRCVVDPIGAPEYLVLNASGYITYDVRNGRTTVIGVSMHITAALERGV